jgi:hypothetical protein
VVKPHFAVAERTDRLSVLDDVGHHHERRVPLAAGAVPVGRAPANADLAEITGCAQLVVLGKLLAANDEHDVLIKGIVECLHRRLIERLAKIDAFDLGAKRGRQPHDRKGHV